MQKMVQLCMPQESPFNVLYAVDLCARVSFCRTFWATCRYSTLQRALMSAAGNTYA
jgi:hypothetical protein